MAVALHCLSGYCQRFHIDHPEVHRYVEYVWRYLPVDGGDQLHQWEREQPTLVNVAIDFDYPDGVEAYLQGQGVDPAEFRILLTSTFDIIYGSLYAATDNAGTLKDLADIVAIMDQHRLPIPDPALFLNSPWEDEHGWGHPLSEAELQKWRAAALR